MKKFETTYYYVEVLPELAGGAIFPIYISYYDVNEEFGTTPKFYFLINKCFCSLCSPPFPITSFEEAEKFANDLANKILEEIYWVVGNKLGV